MIKRFAEDKLCRSLVIAKRILIDTTQAEEAEPIKDKEASVRPLSLTLAGVQPLANDDFVERTH